MAGDYHGLRNIILSAGTARSSMTGPTNMPPTITVASGRCTWLPIPVEIAAGKRPMQAESAVISKGRMRVEAAAEHRVHWREAAKPLLVVKCNHQDAVHDRHAEERDEADGGRDAEIETGEIEREYAANHRVGDARERQKAVAEVIEQAVEQPDNQHEADGHNDLQTFLGFLKVSELARPNQPVSGRKFHVLRDSLLSLLDSAAKVAATDAELDRDEALHALVINPGRSRIQA